MRRLAQSLFSLVLGAGVLSAVIRQVRGQHVMDVIRGARLGTLLLGFSMMLVAYVFRAVRWRVWERELSNWDSLRLILIGFMGNNIFPARLGEILRAHCTSAISKTGRGRTVSLASIAAERVLDGFLISALSFIGIALVPVDHRLRLVLLLISTVFAGLASLFVVGIYFDDQIRRWFTVVEIFPRRLSEILRTKLRQLLDGLTPLRVPSRMVVALLFTVVIWTLELGFYYFVGQSVWRDMTLPITVLFLVVVNFASLIPLTMGGIGTIEAAALACLLGAGVPAYAALAMILLQHSAQYLFTTGGGGILYLSGRFQRFSLVSDEGQLSVRSVPSIVEQTRDTLRNLPDLKPGVRNCPSLSIVIPAYNEESRLPRTLFDTIKWCTSNRVDFEIVVSDDGSDDATLMLARMFEESDSRIRAIACPHTGKGGAVRIGVLNARGQYILFMDADGATPLGEVPKMLSAVEGGVDVAIGSRILGKETDLTVKTSLHRRIIGRVFAFLVRLLAVNGIEDTQCGFKMFRRDSAFAIFSRQKSLGFAFDVEILFVAGRLGLSVAEIPINWVAQPGSKVSIVRDSIKMLWDISRIRWMHRKICRGEVVDCPGTLQRADIGEVW